MTNPLCDPYFILAKVYQGGKYLKQAIADTPIEPSLWQALLWRS